MTAKEQGLPEWIVQAVARGWCSPENSHKVMDADLAFAIAAEVAAALASDTGERGVAGSLVALADKWCENTETRENEIGYVRGVMFAHVSCANELRAALRAQPAGGGELSVAQGQGWQVDATAARFFCDGPNGYFYTGSLEMARKLTNIVDPEGDDWTVTDMLNPHGPAAPAKPDGVESGGDHPDDVRVGRFSNNTRGVSRG